MKRLSNDPAVRLAECRGEPVPPVGGEVKVLACARLKVRELESGRLTVEVAAFDAGQLTERGIVPVYSAAHVTRLQADVETLKEYTAELKHQRDHWFKAHGQLQVSERTLRVERDALKAEVEQWRASNAANALAAGQVVADLQSRLAQATAIIDYLSTRTELDAIAKYGIDKFYASSTDAEKAARAEMVRVANEPAEGGL